MQNLIYPVLTFIAAFGITYLNLSNNDKFFNFFFLINRSGPVLFYSFCYGAIGVILYYLLKDNVIKITETYLKIPAEYLYAIGIGVATKGICDLNFFNIKSGSTTVPIGIKTLTQPIDKYFEKRFDSLTFVRYLDYLRPVQDKYRPTVTDIGDFKRSIITKLSQYHPDKLKVPAFATSEAFTKAADSDETLALVLKEFGKTVFEKIFPL